MVMYDRTDKVLEIDRHSVMAIAGVPATAYEMVRILEPWQNEDYVYVTYFNAGLRVFDIRDERAPKEVGWFVAPDPQVRRGPLPQSGLATQSEDVLVDARGNIFVSDKNHGVYILRHETGA